MSSTTTQGETFCWALASPTSCPAQARQRREPRSRSRPRGAILLAVCASVIASLRGALCSAAEPAPVSPREIVIWPGPPPGGAAVQVKETIVERSTTPGLHDRVLMGIRRPRISVYAPAKPDGSAVLILPGGAYQRVAIDKEGDETARRLSARGITAAVLFYRLPGDGWAAGRDAPLQDAQRALRLLRSGAAGPLDTARIGVLGFSAGGDLAANLLLRPDAGTYEVVDSADRLATRPDFAGFVYPGLHPLPAPDGKAIALESLVNHATPPCFILHAADDQSVPVEGSLKLFSALKAANVPAEMHIFDEGGHGFGIRLVAGKPAEAWPDLFLRWGEQHHFFRGVSRRAR